MVLVTYSLDAFLRICAKEWRGILDTRTQAAILSRAVGATWHQVNGSVLRLEP